MIVSDTINDIKVDEDTINERKVRELSEKRNSYPSEIEVNVFLYYFASLIP